MVVIHLKNSEHDQFLYETTCDSRNEDVISDLVKIWNLRIRLGQLAGSVRDLAKHGVMKPIDKQGIDEVKEKYEGMTIEKNEYYEPDPTGRRCGNGTGPKYAQTMEKVCADAERAIHKDQIKMKFPMTVKFLQDKLDNIRGAVMMAFPGGLPEWDTVHLTLKGEEGLEGTQAGATLLDPNESELYAAGKEFERGQTVSHRLGKNEKTKVIAKLVKKGSGPPGREPAINEEERKAMMAFYYKKNEEMKRLAEADDDDYLSSSWADPKGLQSSLRGLSNIKAPGFR